jgi:hypothetical protein
LAEKFVRLVIGPQRGNLFAVSPAHGSFSDMDHIRLAVLTTPPFLGFTVNVL